MYSYATMHLHMSVHIESLLCNAAWQCNQLTRAQYRYIHVVHIAPHGHTCICPACIFWPCSTWFFCGSVVSTPTLSNAVVPSVLTGSPLVYFTVNIGQSVKCFHILKLSVRH